MAHSRSLKALFTEDLELTQMPYEINTAKQKTCFCEPGKTFGRGVTVPLMCYAVVCTSPLNHLHMRMCA